VNRSCVLLALIATLALVGSARAADAPRPSTGEAVDTQPAQETGFLSYTQPTSSQPQEVSLLGMVKTILGPLLAVVALIYGAAWLFKRMQGRGALGPRRNRFTELVEVMHLGGQRYLYLVRVVDRLMVLGVTGEGISALGEISEEEVTDSLTDGFGGDFSQMLAKMEKRPNEGLRVEDKSLTAEASTAPGQTR